MAKIAPEFIGVCRSRDGATALIKAADAEKFENTYSPSLEEIMVHIERRVKNEKPAFTRN